MKINYRETVFIDTSAFVGLIAVSDSFHESALSVMSELTEKKCKLLTTEFVLYELANSLSSIRFRNEAARFIDHILQNHDVDIEWSTRILFDRTFELYRNRSDKEWSLTDCASFVIMKERGILLAFTFDKHFEQAGFAKLLDS